ncbi:uncharacterized protein LOC113860064 [Abrus precatorius]|uniref:Uncharacterized protein LOC113860064 n=1 Tax=Abrus precatorius TaxID=3816 RepID=A0A8B8KWZ3_ABRPR|nr:uncharacterized protein LOC113860064 [Abrus precatorius]
MDNKIRPLSLSSHSNFFSSLKQVEKRLKFDQSAPLESKTEESNVLSRGSFSLSSPMFLQVEQPSGSQNIPTQDSSEPPQAFLSVSPEFPPTHQDPSQTSPSDHITPLNQAQDDDIERLMQLLGLSEEQAEQKDCFDDGSCHCEGGFYSKIVGVEGPKCRKEVLRLEGWIKYFLNGGGEEKQEPLRLAHLLLGKAAFISEGAGGGFGGLDFPTTIQEFLHTDPPSN